MSQAYIALLGAPNSGKTTLFNNLTGSNFRAVNYPGATVDYCQGTTLEKLGPACPIIDTPGTYSLFPKSFDEKVTIEILFEGKVMGGRPSALVVVIDATQIRRHLTLFEQAKRAGFPLVAAVTMNDLLSRQGQEIDPKILEEELGIPVVLVNGLDGTGCDEIMSKVSEHLKNNIYDVKKLSPWELSDHLVFSAKAQRLLDRAVRPTGKKKWRDPALVTRHLDAVLLHPVFGLLAFFLIMSGFFTSIFWLASPLMQLVDGLFSDAAKWIVAQNTHSLFLDFLGNGIVAAMGSVAVFIPQIMVLFLILGLLEDSGYLARANSLIDKPLSKCGLNGRSFVPILSGYACAIPGMMAARNINNKKERFLTLFIVPLMTCSARLPVYALLLSFLFANTTPIYAGITLAVLYFCSLTMGLIVAAIASRFIKTTEPSLLMMELPFYRRPQIHIVLKSMMTRTLGFITRAAPIIFILAVLMWTGANFPRKNGEANLNQSYLASAGKILEPVMEPMGGDWRTGVSLISAFTAREVFVSSLAVIFNVAETDDDKARDSSLIEKMREAKASNGQKLFTPATVTGLILYFMVALQCLATVGVARREFGSWKWPMIQLVVFNVVGYILAVIAVQGLRYFGIS